MEFKLFSVLIAISLNFTFAKCLSGDTKILYDLKADFEKSLLSMIDAVKGESPLVKEHAEYRIMYALGSILPIMDVMVYKANSGRNPEEEEKRDYVGTANAAWLQFVTDLEDKIIPKLGGTEGKKKIEEGLEKARALFQKLVYIFNSLESPKNMFERWQSS